MPDIISVNTLNWHSRCSDCDKTFKSKSNLNQHIAYVHRRCSYTCEDCGKCFSLSGYRYHRLTAHTANQESRKKFECGVCRKKFLQNKLLKKHMLTHEGEESARHHACPYCSASFKRKDHLNRHITDLHSLISDKLFECTGYTGCQARFQSAGRLKQHMKLHQDNEVYPCQNCGKKILRKKNLNIHMLTCQGVATANPLTPEAMSDESDFQHTSLKCLACDFTYIYPSELEAHLADSPDHNVHAALSHENNNCSDIMDLSTTNALLDDFVTSLLLSDVLVP